MSRRRRVAITGLGLVAPHGNDAGVVFDALCAGTSAIQPFDDATVVAPCRFDPSPWFTRLQLAGVDRVSQMAVAAAESARADAGWHDDAMFDPDRAAVHVGTGFGGAAAVDDAYRRFARGERISPLAVVATMTNAPAAHIAMRVGITGPVLSHSIACASGTVAIAAGARAIADGEVDVALAGGAEALLVAPMIAAWRAMQTLATPVDEHPAVSSRPFSASRSGLVLGEGAAFMVLENHDAATRRGAHIYAEIAGTGLSCDASHLTKPDERGQVKAMAMALEAGGLAPRDVGYCNAHGTATRIGDPVESAAIRTLWGDDLYALRVSSTKALHGHLLGAAGALEALITALALDRGRLPHHAHCEDPDPACALPFVNDEEPRAIEAAISNSFAFGGTNAVLALRRAQ